MSRLVVLALLVATTANAQEEAEQDPAGLLKSANEALAAEKPNEAIAKFEALADRGVVDAVVSYDRGLAYAARVRSGGEQPGDLGHAVHGFEEARELSRDASLQNDAGNALMVVRSEIARRRSRSGESIEIEHGFSLGRAIVDLLPENVWAILATLGTLVLTISLIVRHRVTAARARVAATTSAAVAGGVMLLTSVLSFAARDARLHLKEGVVIAAGARLLDGKHLAMDGVGPIPEGARARIHEEAAGYSKVTVGGADGYLPSSSVLPLAKR